MKAIIGVDKALLYKNGIHLLSRLRFRGMTAECVHVEEPLAAYNPHAFPLTYAWVAETDQVLREAGERLLDTAVGDASSLGIPATRTYLVGSPTAGLMQHADMHHADLVVVGSTQKSKYGSFFLGSVGRGLTIGAHQSVLIAKGEVPAEGPLTVVLATDHSEYAEECIRMFARMHPEGIARLVLVTSVAPNSFVSSDGVPQTEEQKFRRFAEQHGPIVVQHLSECGIPAEYRMVEGDVHEVIDANMADVHADLLVVAAHGHGFIERLLVGSVSLHQAVATPYSVLLLRHR